VEPWQIFILVFVVVLPLMLLTARERWDDDRLTFRGRPTQRDWRRQVDPPLPGAGDH
jgi:hypothetical protein